MDARELFLAQHAQVHSAAMAPAEGVNIEDIVCAGLSDQQLATAPQGMNSVAWLIWHMARSEDMAVNGVLRQEPQVLDGDRWGERLGIDARHIGTGDTSEDLQRFNRSVSVETLRAYRVAVGHATREWVMQLDFDALSETVAGGSIGSSASAFGEQASWVEDFWEGRTQGWFLSWLAAGHHYYHLGEAEVIARQLGRPGL